MLSRSFQRAALGGTGLSRKGSDPTFGDCSGKTSQSALNDPNLPSSPPVSPTLHNPNRILIALGTQEPSKEGFLPLRAAPLGLSPPLPPPLHLLGILRLDSGSAGVPPRYSLRLVLTRLPEMSGIWATGRSSSPDSAKRPQILRPED